MAQKKLYYEFSDNADVSRVIMELSGVMSWIKADMEDVTENDDQREYTITPVWMTEKQYKNLPQN